MQGILGLIPESAGGDDALDGVMQMLLDMRAKAKADKNYALSDEIRNRLSALGLVIRDGKDGSSWSRN
jgi:cysteinyl-tRNA synthetase